MDNNSFTNSMDINTFFQPLIMMFTEKLSQELKDIKDRLDKLTRKSEQQEILFRHHMEYLINTLKKDTKDVATMTESVTNGESEYIDNAACVLKPDNSFSLTLAHLSNILSTIEIKTAQNLDVSSNVSNCANTANILDPIPIRVNNFALEGTQDDTRNNLQPIQNNLKLVKSKDLFQSGDEKAKCIAKLVHEKFRLIREGNHSIGSERHVISGIVMTKGDIKSQTKLVSVSSGTKCIAPTNLSKKGEALNDMHAEVLSRRCLIAYFYDQLQLLVNGEESIFAKTKSGKKFKLKPELQFHLYVERRPCGDATVKNNQAGSLRVKVNSGDGNAISKTAELSWEKLLSGKENLITMSCCDKICKWNVVGLQGAILSQILEPIYLTSIVAGGEAEKKILKRAFYERVCKSITKLPPGYNVNKPLIFQTASPKQNNAESYSTMCVNWHLGCEQPEIELSQLGKPTLLNASKYSKNSFFQRYIQLVKALPTGASESIKGKKFVVYSKIKNSATSYNTVKQKVHASFQNKGFGSWISKPKEQDQFQLII